MSNSDLSFEEAYARLESILQQMSQEDATLDGTLSLYEEADQLVDLCETKLLNAEKRIEKLAKKHDGNLLCNNDVPETEPLESIETHTLSS